MDVACEYWHLHESKSFIADTFIQSDLQVTNKLKSVYKSVQKY